jgi:hypothetical protein
VIELRYPVGYDGGDAILGPLSEALNRRRGALINIHNDSTPLEHTIFIARQGARDAYDGTEQ